MTITTSNPRSPTLLAQIRALMPTRPLSQYEALRIAELQAARLLELGGIDQPPVPEELISGMSRVKVERVSPLPMSGLTTWSRGRWLIVLNHAEPWTRQRFSLFHEAKHLFDHPFISDFHGRIQGQSKDEWAERVCDHFAACVLMPKAWVKAVYCNEGVQQLPLLARRFGVSQVAMQVRLLNLALVDPAPRCRYWRVSDVQLLPTTLAVAA